MPAATITIQHELPDGVTVDTTGYRNAHGQPPGNDHGRWAFLPAWATHSHVPQDQRDAAMVTLNGTLLDVIDQLEDGHWALQS